MTASETERPFDFYQLRPLCVQFSDLELSSDAGILLVRQADECLKVSAGIADCIEEWRDPAKITHSLEQLVSQRVYQLIGGYEDANDSNNLRHDPIYKMACGRLPKAGQNLLASQPTMTRLENRVSKRDNSRIRRFFVDTFVASYAPPGGGGAGY